MKNIIIVLATVLALIGIASAMTPLDAVKSAGTVTRDVVSLENMNPIVFNSDSMNATLGNVSGLNDTESIDTDADWRTGVLAQLNSTV